MEIALAMAMAMATFIIRILLRVAYQEVFFSFFFFFFFRLFSCHVVVLKVFVSYGNVERGIACFRFLVMCADVIQFQSNLHEFLMIPPVDFSFLEMFGYGSV
jgi:hypothetical protein